MEMIGSSKHKQCLYLWSFLGNFICKMHVGLNWIETQLKSQYEDSIIVKSLSLTSEVYRNCLIPSTLSLLHFYLIEAIWQKGQRRKKCFHSGSDKQNAYREAESTSNCKTEMFDSSISLCQMALAVWLATLTAGSWLWYLRVYKKVPMFSFYYRDHSFFGFSKEQFFQRLHSFKGTQLGSDLPVGQSVYSFYSMLLTCLLYQWTKTANNKNRKLHVRGKSEEQALPGSIY